MTAYYNEIDRHAAQWLRNLIAAGHIAPGDVDERSIVDVRPDDLRSYRQCHFFAGIGGWSLALRLAGWPDHRPVWTGSCPCQPFSAAGTGKAADDKRHLWPAWFPLIAERRPAIVFGEQVEAAIGWGWLDVVLADLEGEGYACGTAVLPACGVGAPHIRQRAWFVAHARHDDGAARREQQEAPSVGERSAGNGKARELADTALERQPERERAGIAADRGGRADGDIDGQQPSGIDRSIDELANADAARRGARRDGEPGDGQDTPRLELAGLCPAGADRPRSQGWRIDLGEHPNQRSPWAASHWLPCTDGKARPTEPGTFPLAHGIPGRVGRLRAYGNAIVPQVAAAFIAAVMEEM